MKVSTWRILEIANLTRRQGLQLAAAAAAAAVLPSCTTLCNLLDCDDREVRDLYQRLARDRKFRSRSLATRGRELIDSGLTVSQFEGVRRHLELVNLVTTTLAFQIMRREKELRPILISPAKRHQLLFEEGGAVRSELSAEHRAVVDRLATTTNAIAGLLFRLNPGFSVQIDWGFGQVALTDTGCVDLVCQPDQGCEDLGCADSGCADNLCTNDACLDYGCDDTGCTDVGCRNEFCDDQSGSLCDDQGCTNGTGCPEGIVDFAGCLLPDDVYEGLARRLEEYLDRGPIADFLVRVEDLEIEPDVLLDPGQLGPKLQNLQQ